MDEQTRAALDIASRCAELMTELTPTNGDEDDPQPYDVCGWDVKVDSGGCVEVSFGYDAGEARATIYAPAPDAPVPNDEELSTWLVALIESAQKASPW